MMKNHLFNLDEKNLKSLAFTDDSIITSSKAHKSFDKLLDAKENSGILESVKVIKLKDIKSLSYTEISADLKVSFNKDGSVKKRNLPFSKKEDRDNFTHSLAENLSFSINVEKESKMMPLLKNIGVLLIVSVITYAMRASAIQLENGEVIEVSGRRSGIKRLMLMAAEALGANGVLVVGGIAFLIMGYLTYKRWNNPSDFVTYTK